MRELQDKIKQHIVIDTATECWLWQMNTHAKGYGQLWWKGTTRWVHRLSYQAFIGPIPKGLVIRHTCDTPQCCNPEHLLVGTQADNVRDMYSRGREPCHKGANNPKAKLTDQEVNEIRDLYETRRHTQKELGYMYGVSQTQISQIVRNKAWRIRP